MTRQKIGIGIIAFATLLLELAMIRAFDVILDPSMGYMIVTIAMFALGLGGIFVYIFKIDRFHAKTILPILTLCYALSIVLMLYIHDALPFNLQFSGNLLVQICAWSGMYLTVVFPFFLSGVIFSILFSVYATEISSLYFADLCGAGLGCLLLMFVIPIFGPGGILFLLAGLLCLAAFCVSSFANKTLIVFVPISLILICYPFLHGQYIEFSDHANKRDTNVLKEMGKREYVKWDQISKLEVYDNIGSKYFSLDGGQQASNMMQYDGNLSRFTDLIHQQPQAYYFGLSSLVHYLKRTIPAETLILGAAVGGESKTALIFGARNIDAIEMVGAMVDAAKDRYRTFSGDIFNHPQIRYMKGEARTFLRGTNKQYDIIQMFSNHSSSSITQGNGALESVYLQTVEAYEEYFTHLKPDGILSMNRHYYPRMLTTAAQAWHRLGRSDFHKHVLVFERYAPDTLPTVLIKMTPWTAAEVEEARSYLNREIIGREREQRASFPSPLILRQSPFQSAVICGQNQVDALSLLIGTYGQKALPYPVRVRFSVDGSGQNAEFQLDGRQIHDNQQVVFPLNPPWENVRGRLISVQVSSENTQPDQAFSLWLDSAKQPLVQNIKIGQGTAYKIAFNPVDPAGNLLPAALLAQPFPRELAARADYRLDPVDDNRPFFNMIRKTTRELSPRTSSFLDGGTANILNQQRLPVLSRRLPALSRDVLCFVVVGSMSVLFAALFIFLPLRWTKKGSGIWPAMPWFLVYFSCLGAGFIVIELTLIQLCTKLIGYPTYTYAAVLFALLVSAAFGSFFSRRLLAGHPGRWPWIFLALVAYGGAFLAFCQPLFAHLLQYALPWRWIAATVLIFPLGFFMGMPFPLGIAALDRCYPAGIAWAWGMNGFFTVLGGFLSLVSAFFLGFRITLLIALGIYCVALLAYAMISKARAGLARA